MPILFIVIFKCFVHDKAVSLDLVVVLSCAFFFLFLNNQIFYGMFSHLSPIRYKVRRSQIQNPYILGRNVKKNLSPGDLLSLTAFGWDGLSDMSSKPPPDHRSSLSGPVQCWQHRQRVAQPLWTVACILRKPQGWGQFHSLSAKL